MKKVGQEKPSISLLTQYYADWRNYLASPRAPNGWVEL
jgi:hypothetical protein